MRRVGNRRAGPARYALCLGTCGAIGDLCKSGLTFDEALDIVLLEQHQKMQDEPAEEEGPDAGVSPDRAERDRHML